MGITRMKIEDIVNKLKIVGINVEKAESKEGLQGIKIRSLSENITRLVIPEGIEFICGVKDTTAGILQNRVTSIKFPSTLKVIGDCAFKRFEALEEIEIPRNVHTVGKCAFGFCSRLHNIKGIEHLKIIKDVAFMGTDMLQDVVLGSKLEELGARAFSQSRIKSIDFNGCKISKIGNSTFAHCYDIEKVTGILEHTKSIGEFAFYNCIGLKRIESLTGLEVIEGHAFQYCRNLELEINSEKMEEIKIQGVDGVRSVRIKKYR